MKAINRMVYKAAGYIGQRLPAPVKRTLLLSSLASVLDVPSTDDLLINFNSSITKARELDALKFSWLLGKWIWTDLLVHYNAAKDHSRITLSLIMKSIPQNLKYGSDNDMQNDIEQVLQFCQTHQATA